jgi:hypothetical protein
MTNEKMKQSTIVHEWTYAILVHEWVKEVPA